MKQTASTVAVLAFIALAGPAAHAAGRPVPIAQLHANFEKSGNSTLDMKEYEQRILVSGVVLGQSEAFATPNVIVKVGAAANGDELARMTPGRGPGGQALSALRRGAVVTAECTVEFASNSHYVPLGDCVLK